MSTITGQTKVTGIIGYPLVYTLSPIMHNAAFKATGLNYRYLPFVVEEKDLGAALQGIRALKIRGVNVTMPHKEAVIEFLDELSEEAKIVGAVNTINNRDGCLIGYNTDGTGFIRSLREESFDPKDTTAIILGAGGAAKAVAVSLIQAGASEMILVGRDIRKLEKLKARLLDNFTYITIKTLSFKDNLADIFRVGDLIVNATPVGMRESGDLLPVPLELISTKHFVYDLVYTPLETELIKEARKVGAKVANGLGMLLHQAASAFEIWTGTSAPVEVMRHALTSELEGGEQPNDAKKKDQRLPT